MKNSKKTMLPFLDFANSASYRTRNTLAYT
jgi:hypothetical protein